MDTKKLTEIIENTNAMLNRDGLDEEFYAKIGLRPIHIEGVRGYSFPISSEQANHVGLAHLNENNAESTVQKIIQFYRNEKKSFSWIIGPGSEPKNLVSILLRNGFYHMEDLTELGLAMETRNAMNHVSPGYSVIEIPLERMAEYVDLISESFGSGMNRESAMSIVMMSNAINTTDKYRNQVKAYIAAENDTGKEVGFCTVTMDRDGKYAILDGSAVLPSYRGKGIYKSMISKRMQDAIKNGIEYFIIHALKGTSGPICEKVGFKRICQLDFYGYKIEP